MRQSIFTLTDSYKIAHWKQYPPEVENIYSYLEARACTDAYLDAKEIVFFGLQYILREYLNKKVTWEDLNDARSLMREHFGQDLLNIDGWRQIITEHNGRLPVRIWALPEGTVVPIGTPMLAIENTDPRFPWLPNFLETLLVQLWYPCTVATISREIKRKLKRFLELSGDPSLLPYKLHDFGFRGASSVESAMIGGASHLINFRGTDTLCSLPFLMQYYGALMPGNSIPATEHSTITSWGKSREGEAYLNLLKQHPEGLVACVSDSYDLINAVQNIWCSELRETILNRNGTLVFRPDSGNAGQNIMMILSACEQSFGATKNSKGFKVLNPKVRIIQGDGVNPRSIGDILTFITAAGWSADNIAFGMGGALLQKCDRDTFSFAMKCSQATFRDPITHKIDKRKVFKEAPGKRSKSGRFAVWMENGTIRSGQEKDMHWPSVNLLQLAYENGKIMRYEIFDDVRTRAEI